MQQGFSRQEIKTLGLSSLGGTLEFYDFIIFVFFQSYFMTHFFPKELSQEWQLINTYGAFAAAYVARPFGGVIMAHFGDKFGRKNMFMLSIVLMVIPTFALALAPTFAQVGYFAPIFLVLVRLCQGIAIGGELPGAWVFVREHSPEHSKGAYIGLLTSSVVGGILLGAIVSIIMQLIFNEAELKEWAWRIPFALGGIFGIISVYLRRFLSETPIFKKMKESDLLEELPIKKVFSEHKKGIFISMLITWVLTACVVVLVLIVPNFAKSVLQIEPIINTCLQMGGILFMMIGCISTGALSDHFGISRVCKVFAIFWGVFSLLCFYELYSHKNLILYTLTYLIACYFAGIMNFTPLIMTECFPVQVRFSGISFSYNLAYAIAGAYIPVLLAQMHIMASKTNSILLQISGGIYLFIISIIAYICACLVAKKM
ncbi:MFS transporter [Campylobacter canadensis]|uniref:MFS transporter n=1 Tax=Campylobacter canadensis TaxID=449520 RepID=A0ABS7WSV3_9BACT|nr:MFS transporter [Campylobacter canadensis]MBZ7987456.1 MFS transporter [Campylobacter canadensis]MBZ7995362.1 MFS transporter [Campylobacter canadensis]MBZ7996746.1 MFS transporter [Campylobacter canadensis]MBZ7998651.1 MFS transporter [Campylobacter canadensis]MBZ8004525.1 MFS transporter [Campylobacter canadensis]